MAKSDYTIENIYQKGYSSFKPVGTNTYFKTGSFGITTDPRSANILQEVSTKLSSGAKHIEIEAISSETFDSIPKQQMEEVRRLSKLTGIDISMHGPVIDTTGITQQGFSELNREDAERRITQILQRTKDLAKDQPIIVNFHSAEGIPGSEFVSKRTEEGERKYKRMIAVDRETGKLAPLEKEERFYPGGKIIPGKGELKGVPENPQQRLQIMNHSEWDNALSQLFFNKERADEILETNKMKFEPFLKEFNEGKIDRRTITPEQQNVLRKLEDAKVYIDDLHKQANSLFSKAYEYGSTEQREALLQISQHFGEELKKDKDIFGQSRAIHDLLLTLRNPGLAPEMHVPIEQFAVEQSSKTYGNAAFEAYKKMKDKTPTLVIENPPAGFALSTGEDLKNLVEASRKQFVKKAVEEKKMGESEAKKVAAKIIGATLDVGHMNMLRKYGYTEEEIVKEAERIAPLIKHVHLSDNFGFEHTELPMGMGNVPMKDIMEKLGKKGFDAKKIIEAGQWWQHFKTSPLQPTLEGLGSPIYAKGVAPYWNQVPGFYQDFRGGYGLMLPQTNYEMFGAGFSQLPTELGGQRPGAQGSRMSGKQME